MENLRKLLLATAQSYYTGKINRHISNVEILLTNPAGIGEHQDIQTAIETELEIISRYNDKIEMIHKYFIPKQETKTTDKGKK